MHGIVLYSCIFLGSYGAHKHSYTIMIDAPRPPPPPPPPPPRFFLHKLYIFIVSHVGVNSSEITTTSTPSIETTATSITSCIAITKTTPSRESTVATSTPSSETTAATSTSSSETINSEITATTTSRVNLNPQNVCMISSNHETMVDTVVPIEETPAAGNIHS